jgi:hypothetical protein
MKSLNTILTVIAILLFLLLLRLWVSANALVGSNKELIDANQNLERSVSNFSKQIDPIVKRFGR